MPDVSIEKPITLDVLTTNQPALSATSDMPVIETKPDSVAAAIGKDKPADAQPADATEPEATAATEEVKTEASESATEAEQPESTSASDEPKKAKGVQKRLDELTRQREEAKAQAEAERSEKMRLLALLEAKEKPKADEPVKPKREDFASDQEYVDARLDFADNYAAWKVDNEIARRTEADQRARDEASIADQTKAVQSAYAARVEKFKETHSDYAEKAESPDVSVSIPMAHAIAHSEQGPEIAYYLGSNPAEAKRIASLAPPVQLMELGLIVAKLNAPEKKPVSAAPAPIKPTKPAPTAAEVPDEELSMEAYAEKRKKQWAANARPGMRH